MSDEADRAQAHVDAFLSDALAAAHKPAGRGPNMSAGTGDATQFKLTTHNNKELRVFMVENHFRSV